MHALDPRLFRAFRSMIRRIVMDIEGTTTSIAFVKETLFPYARRVLPSFVAQHAAEEEVSTWLEATRALAGNALMSNEDVIALLIAWIDEDRKATPLKALQGMIWREGYKRGSFVAHVYPDVPAAFERWKAQHIGLAVFSSGSVEAQRLLFSHTSAGDLTPFFDAYFDTTTGSKTDPASYARIAAALEARPEEILFLSDTTRELDAAKAAGLFRVGLAREGAEPPNDHPVAQTFDTIVIEGDSVFVKESPAYARANRSSHAPPRRGSSH